jgi:glycosyltransferase involved in cell wall biosynthesis
VAVASEPDAIVVLTGDKTVAMIVAALNTNIPLGVYIHNVEFREFGGVLLPDPRIRYFANSDFTAKRLRSLFGITSEILFPLVQRERYQIETSREKILFINPTQLKGIEIFFNVAKQLQHLPFRVFESWNLTTPWRNYCLSRIKNLPNVEWCAPTRNVDTLYGSARLLLMPSIWEEAYGRSAVEAQLSGIPVIASRRGGLPEAIGEGGVLVEPDAAPEDWTAAIHRVCTDPMLYHSFCEAASANALRIELSSDFIVATLVSTLREHISAPF